MTDTMVETTTDADPHDALLDAFNVSAYQDHDVELDVAQHVEAILQNQDLEVKEVEVDMDHAHVTAKFFIGGKWKRIIA